MRDLDAMPAAGAAAPAPAPPTVAAPPPSLGREEKDERPRAGEQQVAEHDAEAETRRRSEREGRIETDEQKRREAIDAVLLKEASAAMEHGDFHAAVAAVGRVLEIDSRHPEARAMQQRIADAIRQKARREPEKAPRARELLSESAYADVQPARAGDAGRVLSRRGFILGGAAAIVVLAAVSTIGLIRSIRTEVPFIGITNGPVTSPAGPDLSDLRGSLMGVVGGLNPKKYSEYRVAAYAFAGGAWWLQFQSGPPDLVINSDGTWTAQTRFGSKYAALLVKKSYKPAETLRTLPDPVRDPDVVAVTSIDGPGEK